MSDNIDTKYSVIVIGSGISGLYCALKLAKKQEKVLLITKSEITDSNSYYAQGGMVAVLKDNKQDSVELHKKDTLVAGSGLCEPKTVEFIGKNSDDTVRDLLTFGVEFDRDEEGRFTLTKEAAHSVNRILHSGGDATGREVTKALCNAVYNTKNIELRDNTTVTDIIKNKSGEYCGLELLCNKTGKHYRLYSDIAVLATGGLGQIYKCTTNPIGATGDGFALAYRAGAQLRDLEFVQFHPTALAIDDKKNHNRFLISEAVRGEGAKLCDKDGNYYMKKYDAREDLAPRDIVARANYTETQINNTPNVYLDATIIEHAKLLKRFPTIASKCKEYGIDITKDYIPVAPAAHYFMGGITTDLNGETSIKNLFALGEVASTGLHGANRLASNSLLECVVCAYKTAEFINNNSFTTAQTPVIKELDQTAQTLNTDELKDRLKTTMWQNAGIFRDEDSLLTAKRDVEKLETLFNIDKLYDTKEEYEFRNMLITSKLIVSSALNRHESRGAHYRTDYLQTDSIAKHNVIE